MATGGNALLDAATGKLLLSQLPTTVGQIKQAEIDFGATPVLSKTFAIADAEITAASKIIAQLAYVAPTGRSLDELEFVSFDCICGPGAGTFTLVLRSLQGVVTGKYKINYAASAA